MFLAENDRVFFERRAASSAMAEDARPGCVALFNKNDWTTWHVPAIQCPTHYGWILDVGDGGVPEYWRGVVRLLSDA
jgi:hypothetical protein